MSVTTQSDESIQVTATVSVRVPQNTAADLATDARRRLAAVDGVETATLGRLRTVDPGLSATVVTVDASIETRRSVAELRQTLRDTVGIERVDHLAEP